MVESIEISKVPASGLILHLSGSMLEMIRRPDQTYEYKTIDLSKFDIELNGTDSEGFLRMKVLPRTVGANESMYTSGQTVELDLKRSRIDNVNVRLSPDFVVYKLIRSSRGSKYEIYKNEGKHFLLKVETKNGRRLHNLGDLDDPSSHISMFENIFHDNMSHSKHDLKKIMHDRRIYDGQKLAAELVILQQEGKIVKNSDNKYTHLLSPLS